MTTRGGNGAPETVAPDGRTILGGGGAGDPATFGTITAAGGGASAGIRLSSPADGSVHCWACGNVIDTRSWTQCCGSPS